MTETEPRDWLFDDVHEPKSRLSHKTYKIKPTLPSYTGLPEEMFKMFIEINVYEDNMGGLCELNDFWWFGVRPKRNGGYRPSDPEDKKILDAQHEVWGYLTEWEFVELKAIGPEDSEYFACEKLTKYPEGRWPVDPDTGI